MKEKAQTAPGGFARGRFTSAPQAHRMGAEGEWSDMTRTYAVLGGDKRQLLLADLLEREGRTVFRWGFDRVEGVRETSLEEAVSADVVILPLPLSWDGSTLHLPLSAAQIALSDLWPLLDSRRQLLCGGNISRAVREQARRERLELTDYFGREEVQVGNAVPTAEGAIQAAMEATDRTLHGARALVIGYGRIGKVLAQDLRGLGAEVTACARKYRDLAWIAAQGFHALHTEGLPGKLGAFDVIFNTVPAVILDRARLAELKRGCVVVDVASDPGGVDFAAAEELGVPAVWARGLPGKVAPLTAAEILRDAIDHILKERGESI